MLWWIGNGIRECGSGGYIMKCFKWIESALMMVGAGMKSGNTQKKNGTDRNWKCLEWKLVRKLFHGCMVNFEMEEGYFGLLTTCSPFHLSSHS